MCKSFLFNRIKVVICCYFYVQFFGVFVIVGCYVVQVVVVFKNNVVIIGVYIKFVDVFVFEISDGFCVIIYCLVVNVVMFVGCIEVI